MTVRNCDCKGDCSCDTPKPEIHPRDIVWYGPHPCSVCGKTIAKQGYEFGGREVDYPTDGPIYPNTEWPAHKCAKEGPQSPKPFSSTISATYPTDGEVWTIRELTKPVYTVSVYLDNGVVFEYTVESEEKVREHAAAIVDGGYRHCTKEGLFEHYPAHRILKVKSKGIHTSYPDYSRGT